MGFEIVLGSDPRYEKLVADIYVPTRLDGKLVASIRRSEDDRYYIVELRGPYNPDIYEKEIEYRLLLAALESAKGKLEDA